MMKRLWMLTACMAMLPAALSAQTLPEGTRGPGARRAPAYNTVEGQPIESRKPNNPNEVPAFPGQTHAPYHRTAPFNVTVLLDNMHVPYSLGFLPDGNILLVLQDFGERGNGINTKRAFCCVQHGGLSRSTVPDLAPEAACLPHRNHCCRRGTSEGALIGTKP